MIESTNREIGIYYLSYYTESTEIVVVADTANTPSG